MSMKQGAKLKMMKKRNRMGMMRMKKCSKLEIRRFMINIRYQDSIFKVNALFVMDYWLWAVLFGIRKFMILILYKDY